MTHSPELQAAAYLAGELSRSERQGFEDHLIDCDECWAEVEAGRRGQTSVESLRELAPSHLRLAIRAGVTGRSPKRSRKRRPMLLAAAGLAVSASIATAVIVSIQPSDPAAIKAAVSGYAVGRLPGSATPTDPAPDLSSMHLTPVGAGAGRIGDMQAAAYTYRDPAGRRLMIYTTTTAFPMPAGAQLLDGPDGAWLTHREGVMLLFSRRPHELLILGEDDELVHHAAVALDVM